MRFKIKFVALTSAALLGIGLLGGTALATPTSATLADATAGCAISVTGSTVSFGSYTFDPTTGHYDLTSSTPTLSFTMTAPKGKGKTCNVGVSGTDLTDTNSDTIAASGISLGSPSPNTTGGTGSSVASLGTGGTLITGTTQVGGATSTVTIPQAELDANPAGTYNGTITVTASGTGV